MHPGCENEPWNGTEHDTSVHVSTVEKYIGRQQSVRGAVSIRKPAKEKEESKKYRVKNLHTKYVIYMHL